jgi:hypothetical protein
LKPGPRNPWILAHFEGDSTMTRLDMIPIV